MKKYVNKPSCACNALKNHASLNGSFLLSGANTAAHGGEPKITTFYCLCDDFLIPESVWRGLMNQLAARFHESDSLKIYLADSLSVPACRNIRTKRCKIEFLQKLPSVAAKSRPVVDVCRLSDNQDKASVDIPSRKTWVVLAGIAASRLHGRLLFSQPGGTLRHALRNRFAPAENPPQPPENAFASP